jgi:hypothetical protein
MRYQMKIAGLLCGTIVALQPVTSRPAVPFEPLAAIVDAFRTHSIVALTAGHGDAVGYSFGLSLVRDPRIADLVHDIVVEVGSACYQDLADRYVRGDQIAIESIRAAWRETTQTGLGLDEPWETFYRAVRELNASRPRERQIRVLLGDPPIEWENVKTAADHRRWIEMRDWYPADLIRREVIAKNRRALLLYGQMHFQRKNIAANYESDGPAETIVSRLEKNYAARVFTIFTVADVSALQADAGAWPMPSLAIVRGTVLGATDFTFYYPSEAMGRFAIRDGKPDFSAPIPRDLWKTLRAEDQFDAVLVTRVRGAASPFGCAVRRQGGHRGADAPRRRHRHRRERPEAAVRSVNLSKMDA